MEKFHEIRLSYDELALIDGKIGAAGQKIIDNAKRERSYGMPIPLLNRVLLESEKSGVLTWRVKNIRECPLCDKKRSYHKHPRSGRHHRKGDPDTNKPVHYGGVAFNEGFVVFAGQGDCCIDCFTAHKMKETIIDYILEKDLKIQIQKNDYKPTRYTKDPIRVCFDCKEKIQESKMGMLPAIFGGSYPGECYKCSAKSIPFGKSHESTNEFVMLEDRITQA